MRKTRETIRGSAHLRMLPVLVALALGVAACARDTTPAEEPAGDDEQSSLERVAILLPGKQDDPGFSGVGFQAVSLAAEKYGFEVTVAEEVVEAQQVEVYRDFASQEYDAVVGWGGQFADGAFEVAEDFPDVLFVAAFGAGANNDNAASVLFASEQYEFLLGYIAAKLNQTGRVGVVTGPCFEASARQVHGFRDGVKFVDPNIDVLITGLDSFDDPASAKEAALALIAEEADNIYSLQNTGHQGVFEAAEDALVDGTQVFVYTYFADQHQDAPDVILSSSIWQADRLLDEALGRIADGTWDGSEVVVPLLEDEEAIAPFRGLAPDSLYDEAKELQGQIARGEMSVEADTSCPYQAG